MKKYTAKDLDVHTYGRGRNKLFIAYTDYEKPEGKGPIWHTKVFPDTVGNKRNAIRECLFLLNSDTPAAAFMVKRGDFKIQISYSGRAF